MSELNIVISLGGSIIAPITHSLAGPDSQTISAFLSMLREYLAKHSNRSIVLVVGGGATARTYQNALRTMHSHASNNDQDWIGIMATRLNAELIRRACPDICSNPVIIDPEVPFEIQNRIVVAAGWKPGFSTDYVAVVLAEKLRAKRIINISNIDRIYSADPSFDSSAVPLDTIDWSTYLNMVGTQWVPGKNLPFDPLASQKACALKLKVFFVGGSNMDNIKKVLEDTEFFGSVIEQ